MGETVPVIGLHRDAEQTTEINDIRRCDYNIETGENVSYNPYGHIDIEIQL